MAEDALYMGEGACSGMPSKEGAGMQTTLFDEEYSDETTNVRLKEEGLLFDFGAGFDSSARMMMTKSGSGKIAPVSLSHVQVDVRKSADRTVRPSSIGSD